MTDWEDFTSDIPWHVAGRPVSVGETRAFTQVSPIPEQIYATFPRFSQLLSLARATPVTIGVERNLLLGWSTPGGSTGWLCPRASEDEKCHVHPQHRMLLGTFGGITERWNEPENTWLLNLTEALTENGSASAVFIEDYCRSFTARGSVIPIKTSEWYSIAREANGNSTICHFESGRVLLFAPDHAFDHITPLDGCPEYTLYTINEADDFRGWVECVARQWLDRVS